MSSRIVIWVRKILALAILAVPTHPGLAQPTSDQFSVARQWNEVLLESIRHDLARPTIHARNLFHVSAAMYDAWAVISRQGEPYFLGHTVGGYPVVFEGFTPAEEREAAAQEAISYAAYRLIAFRYRHSPGYEQTLRQINALMAQLGYDPSVRTTDYTTGDPAALGNYLAQEIINFGLQDGANERDNYANRYYAPVNEPMDLSNPDSIHLNDPNRWQALSFQEAFVDQGGNVIRPGAIPFLSPDWGHCVPFALSDSQRTVYERDGQSYPVYLDPGAPPLLDTAAGTFPSPYQWSFGLVAVWSSQLDPNSGATIDISPGAMGNVDPSTYPAAYRDYASFYQYEPHQNPDRGHTRNPVTGASYPAQVVPLGDYTRVLAEFWADGPDSETPPGHWYVLLNYVTDHPSFRRQLGGAEEEIPALEWDVKAYFTLGGAMHDSAIAAWSVKGYYDYIRPISAIRYMAAQGQCSDPALPHFSPTGLPLISGYIELITAEDALLRGDDDEHVGKVKLLAWRGHDYIQDAATDSAGVGWIRAETWWPYQRPSFVTPPFAGYVSGHSTFSRAAAEVLTRLTGSEFFPGGLGEFVAKKDSFLVFEKGPSQDVKLQWATYYDAADQCSLSRIWGGIHAPADDIPGRMMGAKIGEQAYANATRYFARKAQVLTVEDTVPQRIQVYPNPTPGEVRVVWPAGKPMPVLKLTDITGREHPFTIAYYKGHQATLDITHLVPGIYVLSAGRVVRIIKQ